MLFSSLALIHSDNRGDGPVKDLSTTSINRCGKANSDIHQSAGLTADSWSNNNHNNNKNKSNNNNNNNNNNSSVHTWIRTELVYRGVGEAVGVDGRCG